MPGVWGGLPWLRYVRAPVAAPGHLPIPDLAVTKVPRVQCPEHGLRQIGVPWAEDNIRLTALFEAFVIDWLR